MIRHRSRRRKQPQPAEPAQDVRAFAYVRVSSDAQVEFSPDAQHKNVTEHARRHGLEIVRWFEEARSAKEAGGRPQFSAMLAALKKPGAPKHVIFDKADRSARNLRDYAELDDLLRSHGVRLHFVRDGLTVAESGHRGSRLAWGFLMNLAKDYSENLSEEVLKGLGTKASRGLWPGGTPPRGYRIGEGSVLEPTDHADAIRAAFLETAAGSPVSAVGAALRARGVPVSRSQTAWLLRSVVYRGDISFAGKVHAGQHRALVSREEWAAAQAGLDDRRIGGRRPKRDGLHHELAGLIRCVHCGCQLTGATKRAGTWIAYRCTGRRTGGHPCTPYVREHVLLGIIGHQLSQMTLGDALAEAVAEEIRRAHREETDFRQREEARMARGRQQLQHRLDRAYADAADGVLSRADYQRLTAGWRAELDRLTHEQRTLDAVTVEHRDRALEALDLARNVGRLWTVAKPGEARRAVLTSVARMLEWDGATLALELKHPFDSIALEPGSAWRRPGWWAGSDDAGTVRAIAEAFLAWARTA